jgi:DHA3 family macrolide efflux protein-like MFS transporter
MGESVFKNKNYVLMFLGLVVSNLGTQIYNFAIMLYIYDLLDGYEFNAAIAGAYMATGGIVFFVLTPFAGAITDRLNKVRVVYLTDIINGIAVILAGFAIFYFDDVIGKLVILFITSIILSGNGALFNPAVSSLPAHILKKEQLQQASSLTMGMYSLYAIIGAFIGTFFYTNFIIEFIFIFNGLSFIISGISEMFISIKTKDDETHMINFKQIVFDIKEGLKYLYNLKPIFYLLTMATVLNFFTVPVIVNGLPYLIYVELEANPVYLAILQGAFPVGVIIMSIVLMMKPQREKQSGLIIRGMIGMATMFLIFIVGLELFMRGFYSFNIFIYITVPLMIIMGLFNAELNIPFDVSLKKQVDKEMMGRVFSVTSVISNGLSPIAIALAGLVISFFGVMVLFYAGAIAMILTAIYTAKNKYIAQL